jgi:hypothetical protein
MDWKELEAEGKEAFIVDNVSISDHKLLAIFLIPCAGAQARIRRQTA